jgi:hypothetical protein
MFPYIYAASLYPNKLAREVNIPRRRKKNNVLKNIYKPYRVY